MNETSTIWREFCRKMQQDQLCQEDFTEEMGSFLEALLCGEASEGRRQKFLAVPYEEYQNPESVSILLHCVDDEYRFDFVWEKVQWKLAFIECITLPISDVNELPYINFRELPDKEIDIRNEKELSQKVFLYNKLKELVGKEEAVKMFLDGTGEYLCARSWVPFYSGRLSYIAYAAWMEKRIHGERVKIESFTEQECCLRFCQHSWRKLYAMTGHLREIINYEEFLGLFEAIWQDRAKAAGWKLHIAYEKEDTILYFS